MMNTFLRLGALLAVSTFLTLPATAQHAKMSKTMSKDIVDTAVSAGSFNTLAAAVTAADLIGVLKSDGPFTVFAPTDEAFAALPAGTLETLLKPENKDKLISILTYHVVPGDVKAAKVVKLDGAATVNGQRAKISVSDGNVMIDNANVVATDVMASNGTIHVIDRVIMPSFDTIPAVAAGAGTFKTLLAAVEAAGLADVLGGEGPFTVFAPTDDAFAALPSGTVESLLKPENLDKLREILKYHVVAGRQFSEAVVGNSMIETLAGTVKISTKGGVKVNDANVVATDINASNGVVHVIDAVLIPAENQSSVEGAREVIRLAIDKGVPLFNSGQMAACAAIYEVAAASLMTLGSLPSSTFATLHEGMREMRSTHRSGERAWVMRRALDRVYDDLGGAEMASARD